MHKSALAVAIFEETLYQSIYSTAVRVKTIERGHYVDYLQVLCHPIPWIVKS